jgi:16S rRNA processing protein RimM
VIVMKPALRPYLVVGKITAPHGVNGAMRVLSMTQDNQRFHDLKDAYLLDARDQMLRSVTVDSAHLGVKQRVIIRIAGITNRTEADELRNLYLAVNRNQAIELPPDSWFVCDLVGSSVFDEHEGFVGRVQTILQLAAQDVYVIEQEGEPDLLFPAIQSIIKKVDPAHHRIDIDLPEGLYEIYRKKQEA